MTSQHVQPSSYGVATLDTVSESEGFEAIIGQSQAIRRAIALARRAVNAPTIALLEGPTGSGKELLAGAIHSAGSRCAKPFVAVNCGRLSETLLPSELRSPEGRLRGSVARPQGTVRGRGRRHPVPR